MASHTLIHGPKWCDHRQSHNVLSPYCACDHDAACHAPAAVWQFRGSVWLHFCDEHAEAQS